MTYNVRKLITKAFNLSGIVSRRLQTVTGDQITEGLELLNLLLNNKSIDLPLIPYFREFEFTSVAGEENYFIDNLVYAETLTFNIGEVRYSTRPQTRKDYFGNGRIDNIETLPFSWRFERGHNGAYIYLYFVPNTAYPIKIWGKFALDEVTSLDLDLLTIYDLFYIEYLKYGLAELICQEYNITFLPQAAKYFLELKKRLADISAPDLSTQKMSTLQKRGGLNYGDVNIGLGWRP